ncbi:hypothetical protein CBR_g12353 [Chara braunii]|uniref:Uncharacterized protein n=1 Tax=Chara braunii TaxID=69332 RepID=A0A388KRT9_CHABU|nr:hypothetical protein CBR_g12353 [Chara braunii]|eukprot:GBG72785.1 hypothetical protein CBR_g12353 [Chara braunii]
MHLVYVSPECAGKTRVTVGDDALRSVVISHDSVENDVGDLTSANAIAAQDKTCMLREAIDNNQDSIMTELSGWKKGTNEIHRDGLPTTLRSKIYNNKPWALDWVGGLHRPGCGAVVFLNDDNGATWYCCGGVEKSESARNTYDGRTFNTFFLTSVFDKDGTNWVKEDKKVGLDLRLFQGYSVKAFSMKAFDVRGDGTELRMLTAEQFLSRTNGYRVTGCLLVVESSLELTKPLAKFSSPADQLPGVVKEYREAFSRLPLDQQADCAFVPFVTSSRKSRQMPSAPVGKRKQLAACPAPPLPAASPSSLPTVRGGHNIAQCSSEATEYDDRNLYGHNAARDGAQERATALTERNEEEEDRGSCGPREDDGDDEYMDVGDENMQDQNMLGDDDVGVTLEHGPGNIPTGFVGAVVGRPLSSPAIWHSQGGSQGGHDLQEHGGSKSRKRTRGEDLAVVAAAVVAQEKTRGYFNVSAFDNTRENRVMMLSFEDVVRDMMQWWIDNHRIEGPKGKVSDKDVVVVAHQKKWQNFLRASMGKACDKAFVKQALENEYSKDRSNKLRGYMNLATSTEVVWPLVEKSFEMFNEGKLSVGNGKIPLDMPGRLDGKYIYRKAKATETLKHYHGALTGAFETFVARCEIFKFDLRKDKLTSKDYAELAKSGDGFNPVDSEEDSSDSDLELGEDTCAEVPRGGMVQAHDDGTVHSHGGSISVAAPSVASMVAPSKSAALQDIGRCGGNEEDNIEILGEASTLAPGDAIPSAYCADPDTIYFLEGKHTHTGEDQWGHDIIWHEGVLQPCIQDGEWKMAVKYTSGWKTFRRMSKDIWYGTRDPASRARRESRAELGRHQSQGRRIVSCLA